MSKYTVDVFDETEELPEARKVLVLQVVEAAMASEQLQENSEVSVTFVTDERIHELNKEFRHKDRPTDVLSFALNDNRDDVAGEGMPDLLGDIIISVPRAKAQAEEYGHSIDRELGFLAVHGLLHLTGYNHETEQDEQMMFKKQEDILQSYGLKK